MAASSRNALKTWDLDVRPLESPAKPAASAPRPQQPKINCSVGTFYSPGVINCVRGTPPRRPAKKTR